MKLITSSTVAKMNSNELSQLFREVSRELHRTEPGTTERAVGLASLENIILAMMLRLG